MVLWHIEPSKTWYKHVAAFSLLLLLLLSAMLLLLLFQLCMAKRIVFRANTWTENVIFLYRRMNAVDEYGSCAWIRSIHITALQLLERRVVEYKQLSFLSSFNYCDGVRSFPSSCCAIRSDGKQPKVRLNMFIGTLCAIHLFEVDFEKSIQLENVFDGFSKWLHSWIGALCGCSEDLDWERNR